MNGLSVAEKNEISIYAENAIRAAKGNMAEMGRLALMASSAASSAQARSETLANQGFLKNLWNNITGKNRKTQNNINYNNARAVALANQLIVKLMQQEEMTLGIVCGVQSRLNAGISAAESEINELYEYVSDIYTTLIEVKEEISQIKSDMQLLQWVNMVEVSDKIRALPPEIAVCKLALDFYRIKNTTYNKWDLMQLKSALKRTGLQDEKISYKQFVRSVCSSDVTSDLFRINSSAQKSLTPAAVGVLYGSDNIYDKTGADPDITFDVFDFAQMLLIEYAEIENSNYTEKVNEALPEMIKEAKNGNVRAQYDVALVYLNRGDYHKAWECMRIAAMNGSDEAREFIRKAEVNTNE